MLKVLMRVFRFGLERKMFVSSAKRTNERCLEEEGISLT
jgi:hypothetical protein